MTRTISFAISTDFVIWLSEQLAEGPCVGFCRLLILSGHRWQMEVGRKVRVPLTNTDDHRRHVRILFAPVHNANRHPLVQVCFFFSSFSYQSRPLVIDAIHKAQMSRFVRASKYRQEKLRIHLEADN